MRNKQQKARKPGVYLPTLAPGQAVAACVWEPGKPGRVGIVVADELSFELAPDRAVELGRSLIATATQVFEQAAFTEFLAGELIDDLDAASEKKQAFAQGMLSKYLVWRAQQMVARFEAGQSTKAKSA